MRNRNSRLNIFNNPRAIIVVEFVISIFLIFINMVGPFLDANYDLIESGMSQLALGEHAWIGILNFVLSSLLFTGFARLLILNLPSSSQIKMAAKMLNTAGLFLFLLVFFKTDLVRGSWPLHRIIHEALAYAICGLVPLACLFIASGIKKDVTWRSLSDFVNITGAFVIAVDALSVFFFFQIHIIGLQERLMSLAILILMLVISVRIWRLPRFKRNSSGLSSSL
jgi:Protein of unknown function (DUF998)